MGATDIDNSSAFTCGLQLLDSGILHAAGET